jgi:hypothetical protein
MLKKIRAMQKARRQEFQICLSNGYRFDKHIEFDDLSINEMNDLTELEVGEATYLINEGDVIRTA